MTNRWMPIIFVTILAVLGRAQFNNASPRVQTSQGVIIGKVSTDDRLNQKHHVFLGIPYAKPPVGNLRFAAPERFTQNFGTLNATSYGNVCPQSHPGGRNDGINEAFEIQSEDCLYLNVFVQESRSAPGNNTPVLFIVHGGGFVSGSSNGYPEHGVLNNLVSRGILVVTVNYRLGPFGFLVDNATNTVGNFGILDQIEALRWVKREIRNFGGDPNKVTVYGESAGSSAVSLLTMMPAADSLFNQTFLMSCSIIVPAESTIRQDSEVIKASAELAQALNCSDHDTYFGCMRSFPWKTIQDKVPNAANTPMIYPNNELPRYGPVFMKKWGPLVPEDWLKERVRKRKVRPMLAGVDRNEAAFFMMKEVSDSPDANETLGEFSNSSVHLYLPMLLAVYDKQYDQRLLHEGTLRYQELPSNKNPNSSVAWFEQVTQMYTDMYFAGTLYYEAAHTSKQSVSAFLFSLDWAAPEAQNPKYSDYVPHAVDVCYMMGIVSDFPMCKMMGIQRTSANLKVADIFGQMTAEFVKYGNPNYSGLPRWPPVKIVSGRPTTDYLSLTPTPTIGSSFHSTAAEYWAQQVMADI